MSVCTLQSQMEMNPQVTEHRHIPQLNMGTLFTNVAASIGTSKAQLSLDCHKNTVFILYMLLTFFLPNTQLTLRIIYLSKPVCTVMLLGGASYFLSACFLYL